MALNQHYVMLKRNLLYTALTRAKQLALVVGNRRAIELAVKNDDTGQRHTYLAQRLRDHG